MSDNTFSALLLEEAGGDLAVHRRELPLDALPEGDLLVAVKYSTLNYKDGMILNGLGRLVRQYPHVPGVNLAGTVLHSDHPAFTPGQAVIATGYRLGEVRWGGYATRARLLGDHVVPLPPGLTTWDAMAVGTAGFAAMQALLALEEHGLQPDRGEVLVTGAAGGVGSIAIALLAKLGYRVAAVTGRPQTADYLGALGASHILARDELAKPPDRPLDHQLWAGCIDAVGGVTLARVLSQLQVGASVAAVGLAGGNDFHASVIPFLLRGVNLLGIDAPNCPMPRRVQIWNRLARDLPRDCLSHLTTTVPLDDVPTLGKEILAGNVRGRIVVDVNR